MFKFMIEIIIFLVCNEQKPEQIIFETSDGGDETEGIFIPLLPSKFKILIKQQSIYIFGGVPSGCSMHNLLHDSKGSFS